MVTLWAETKQETMPWQAVATQEPKDQEHDFDKCEFWDSFPDIKEFSRRSCQGDRKIYLEGK